MIASILCPVDFSPFSERALRYAAGLASWHGAALSVMWVKAIGLTGRLHDAASDEATAALERFAASSLGSAPRRLLIREGPVVSEIVQAGADVDLIVMGTHGAGGLERLLVGSVAEKVLRKATCPVITVPRGVTVLPETGLLPDVIVCAIDFSPSSRRAFRHALSLAEKAHGRLLLLHALEWVEEEEDDVPLESRGGRLPTSEEDARAEIEELVPAEAYAKCDAEVLIGYGNPSHEILRVASEREARLIVLGVQGRGALDLTLFGSTAQHVVRDATCPVLTVGVESGAN